MQTIVAGEGTSEDDPAAGDVHLLSQPVQCVVIGLVILLTVASNVSIILNIGLSELKRRNTNFVLIKHLCIVDLCGAILIVPVPLAATIQGKDNFVLIKHLCIADNSHCAGAACSYNTR
jgi:hypothetical protein